MQESSKGLPQATCPVPGICKRYSRQFLKFFKENSRCSEQVSNSTPTEFKLNILLLEPSLLLNFHLAIFLNFLIVYSVLLVFSFIFLLSQFLLSLPLIYFPYLNPFLFILLSLFFLSSRLFLPSFLPSFFTVFSLH